jgi:hypothetical protein
MNNFAAETISETNRVFVAFGCFVGLLAFCPKAKC